MGHVCMNYKHSVLGDPDLNRLHFNWCTHGSACAGAGGTGSVTGWLLFGCSFGTVSF